MLQNLHVKNLALIQEADVEFGPGLNILSGETGAGKSILIGSINLALGGKASRDLIRDEKKPALVELAFTMEQRERELLARYDLESGEEDTLIITRKLSGGRSSIRINGESVSLQVLKEITADLIDIHGQHDHQSLLHRSSHLQILDTYGGKAVADKREEVASQVHSYRQTEKQLESFGMDEEQRLRQVDFLEFEINEIRDASLEPGEDERLEEQYRKMSNTQKITEAMSGAHELLDGDSGLPAADGIGRAAGEISGILSCDEGVEPIYQSLLEVEDLCREAARQILDYLENSSYDEEQVEQTRLRLDQINRLKVKYGNSLEDIDKAREEKEKELERLVHYEEERTRLVQELQESKDRILQYCEQLTALRKKAAKGLTREIIGALTDLNFLDVRFEIAFGEGKSFGPGGMDEVEFLISTNPGEPLRPLKKIASGGELSRIMLAIKTILARQDQVGTMIFDEIDAGISGRTAQKVAEKLAALSRTSQILCITHLPQIASMADVHFLIEKNASSGNTQTVIKHLEQEQIVEELARMLGGAEITSQVLESAREMKKLAEQIKE